MLVEPNVPVKKGQQLFQFDRRPYAYKVDQLEAELAGAKQNVLVVKADWEVAVQKVATAASEVEYANWMHRIYDRLAKAGGASEEDAQKWTAQMKVNESGVKEAQAEVLAAA